MASERNGQWPYRFALIPLDELFVDVTYQRPLSNFAERITRNYNPAMVGTLVVSERSDRRRKASYAVVDGQTRMAGMAANLEPLAPCLVYEGLTAREEAKLFADLQTQRRGMATFLRFRAALISGDEEAEGIARVVREAGMKVAGDGDGTGIKSIAALEWLYRKDPEVLARVLSIVSMAWPEEQLMGVGKREQDERTRGAVLKGIGRFVLDGKGNDDARIAQRMGRVTPSQLQHRANALREGSGSSGSWDRYIRDALVGIYGGRRQSGDS